MQWRVVQQRQIPPFSTCRHPEEDIKTILDSYEQRMPQILYIQPTTNAFAELYQAAADAYNETPMAERNSGFDLFSDASDTGPLSDFAIVVSQGCRAVAIDTETGETRAFWLAPRSSISRTPWRMANSLGLIDAPYRGIIAAGLTHNMAHLVPPVFYSTFNRARLCQLVAADLRPWLEVRVVSELPVGETARGERGFGSTGR